MGRGCKSTLPAWKTSWEFESFPSKRTKARAWSDLKKPSTKRWIVLLLCVLRPHFRNHLSGKKRYSELGSVVGGPHFLSGACCSISAATRKNAWQQTR